MADANRIHVQHVLLSLEPGGLENGVVNVANGLDQTRFRSSVCCLRHVGDFATRIRTDAVAIHDMASPGGKDLMLPFRLARLFRATRTDVVHTRNAEAFFYGFLGAKIAGIPAVIHSEHGRTFTDGKLRYLLQRMASTRVNAIFSVTEQLKRDLVKHIGIPAERIRVLYNGVDLKKFSAARQGDLRRQLGLGNNDLIVGSVGRLVPVKNYALLLNAVHKLRAEHVHVVLVGDGPERAALEELARSVGMATRVHCLGHRNDVAELVPQMDIFVLPSLSEGMSNTLLEAMAAGVPVIASQVGGSPEIVRNEKEGLLFCSDDVAELQIKLQRLVGNPSLRIQLGDAGRHRVLRDFSMDAMLSRYEDLYQSVFSSG